MDRVILHCDINNFFASVEMILNSDLQGKPIAVCGDPNKRHGIVLAKSEQAKKYGVKTGDVIWEAKQKCPEIIIVPASHGVYGKYSEAVQEIYYRYTDKIESFGSDECWLDVTASLKLLGLSGAEIADEIRAKVKEELKLTISAGVSWNKTFAKLGSDYKKPDATTQITRANYQKIVWEMPIENMLFVGRKSRKLFESLAIKTIGDLAAFNPELLKSHIGINAESLIRCARGEDSDEVSGFRDTRIIKSVGNGTTLPYDLTALAQVEQVIYLLSEEVAYRMRKKGVKGFTVNLSVKNTDLVWRGAQESIREATNSVRTIMTVAVRIFKKLYKVNSSEGSFKVSPVRALRVSVSNLTTDSRVQLNFLESSETEDKNDRLSAVFDTIRKRYGTGSVYFGVLHNSKFDMEFNVLDE